MLWAAGLGASVTTSHWKPRELQACAVIAMLRNICSVSNGLRRQICEILLYGADSVAESGDVVAGGGERSSWQTGSSSWCRKLLSAEEEIWCASLAPLHELYIQGTQRIYMPNGAIKCGLLVPLRVLYIQVRNPHMSACW